MKLSKQEIIKNYGLNDGKDEKRYETAQYYARIVDKSVEFVFNNLVILENRGMIEPS